MEKVIQETITDLNAVSKEIYDLAKGIQQIKKNKDLISKIWGLRAQLYFIIFKLEKAEQKAQKRAKQAQLTQLKYKHQNNTEVPPNGTYDRFKEELKQNELDNDNANTKNGYTSNH